MARGKEIKDQLKTIERDEAEAAAKALLCALEFPNDTHPDVPVRN